MPSTFGETIRDDVFLQIKYKLNNANDLIEIQSGLNKMENALEVKEKKKKALFIFNMRSGKGTIKNRLADIIDIMVKSGYEVTAHPTQGRGDACRMVREESEGYDLVVCGGGDGTLDEAVTGMMQREDRVPMGYIPAGSTNDFGSSLKIPRDVLKAAEIAVKGVDFRCDIGAFNDDSFVYVAAFGLFTDVSYQTSQELKNILGHVAYLLEAAKKLYNVPAYQMEVEVNGDVIRDRFIYGMITNSSSIGGIRDIAGKNVKLDDGLFELTLIREPQTPLELNEILASLVNLVDDTELIYTYRTDHVVIRTEEEVSWTLDGEYGGTYRDVDFRCMQKALSLRVRDLKSIGRKNQLAIEF